MRNLAARIEWLEEVYSPPDVVVVMLVDFVGDGPLLRFKSDNGFCIERQEGESEDAFTQRTESEVKAYHRSYPSPPNCCMVLFSERERLPNVKPELEPEPKPDPAPVRQPAPAVQSEPKPRQMTLKEVES